MNNNNIGGHTMPASKKTTKKSTASKSGNANGYVFQPFGAKSVALIYKFNLQSEDSYKKLITSFERITSLPDTDPRKENLIDLWETEFNRIFVEFWESHSGKAVKKKTGVEGWKDRLDVKDVAQTPDQKRQDLLSRLTPGFNTNGRTTKEEILQRAGYQERTDTASFNFLAEGKTGQNLRDLESLLDVAEENGLAQPESLLNNATDARPSQPSPFSTDGLNYDEDGYLISDDREHVKPDPALASFVGTETKAPVREEVAKPVETPVFATEQQKDFVVDEGMTREQFNVTNQINPTSEEAVIGEKNPIQQPDDAFVPFDLETGTFDESAAKQIHDERLEKGTTTADLVSRMVYTKADEMIDPSKRNIVSKEGFEIFKEKATGTVSHYEKDSGESKPYHEIKPIGDYQVSYDHNKRPSYADMIEANEREEVAMDELQEKIEFLRDLRNERRHRINMMKIERANSFLIARTKRLAELRDNKRVKRRDDLNLRAIEKADKLRRAQERQKIVQLMKERQMKRSEERRVASILKLERERRFERDAKYRSDVAALDAQIRHEQELIKRTELKMKAYFAKNHDDVDFDKSLNEARKVSKYVVNAKKAEKMLRFEERKRSDRIEKISKKFNKNVK
jgi:hypothetical protein